MSRFKKLSHRITLAGQITAVVCLFALLPMLIFAAYLLDVTLKTAVETRTQELSQRTGQLVTQVEKEVDLCNISSQVFLNTPSLIEHLTRLKNGDAIQGQELKAFYDNDIASLEKVVVANPYLYQVRVYSVADDINELVPILYSASRMARLSWAQEEVESGTWQLDFSDQLFDSNAVTPHIMSLVTEITTAEAGKVGTLEVAVRMDSVLPLLFSHSDEEWAVLVDAEGNVLVGEAQPELAAELAGADMDFTATAMVETKLGRQRVLVSVCPLDSLGCTYVQVDSLEELFAQTQQKILWGGFTFLVVMVLVILLIHRICKAMLRQFYAAFDAVNQFSAGDLEASVPVESSESEIGRFSMGINEMLSRIRQLMQDNINRELLGKNAELRALQNQINAHFIYNVLEAIKMMAEIDEEYEISDAVTNLGKLLRYSMKWNVKSVTIKDEIENIRNYLALMNLRFDNEISLRLELPVQTEAVPDILAQNIPKMSLQPIVENAVVHGMEGISSDTEILLRAAPDSGQNAYWLEIIDHGCGMDESTVQRLKDQISGEIQTQGSSGNGLGLKNVQDRIRLAFGTPYGLTVSSEKERYTKVAVYLPYTHMASNTESGGSQKGDSDTHGNGFGSGR